MTDTLSTRIEEFTRWSSTDFQEPLRVRVGINPAFVAAVEPV